MSKYPLSFSQGVTVVPNTLLLEVTQSNEAIRAKERERIINILKLELTGNPLLLDEVIFLINDRNVL